MISTNYSNHLAINVSNKFLKISLIGSPSSLKSYVFLHHVKGFIYLETFLFYIFHLCHKKSFLLKTIAHAAMEQGLKVCISAPTGKLASIYAEKLPFVDTIL